MKYDERWPVHIDHNHFPESHKHRNYVLICDETGNFITWLRSDYVKTGLGGVSRSRSKNGGYHLEDIIEIEEPGEGPIAAIHRFEEIRKQELEQTKAAIAEEQRRLREDEEFAQRAERLGYVPSKPRATFNPLSWIMAVLAAMLIIYASAFIAPPIKSAVRRVTPVSLPFLCSVPSGVKTNGKYSPETMDKDGEYYLKGITSGEIQVTDYLLEGNCIQGLDVVNGQFENVKLPYGLLVTNDKVPAVTLIQGAGEKSGKCLPLMNNQGLSLCLGVQSYQGNALVLLDTQYWVERKEPQLIQPPNAPKATSSP